MFMKSRVASRAPCAFLYETLRRAGGVEKGWCARMPSAVVGGLAGEQGIVFEAVAFHGAFGGDSNRWCDGVGIA
ncbi:hypothetical protein CFELI_08930 [Corynebacterium felinum]|nr:hypothetical protein CFELI_08930 [Corynebacterium felinum]